MSESARARHLLLVAARRWAACLAAAALLSVLAVGCGRRQPEVGPADTATDANGGSAPEGSTARRDAATGTTSSASGEPRKRSKETIFDELSPYGRVTVIDKDNRRCLLFDDGGEQTCLDLSDPDRVVHEYMRFMAVSLLFVRDAPRTLMVGLGGGAATRLLIPHVAGLKLDIVELNPVVAQVAKDFFDVQPSDRLAIHVADGRKFLQETKERWDMVWLDAYGSAAIPFPLATTEFMHAVAERVEPGGALVSNIWYRNDKLFRAMLRTIHEHFPFIYVFKGVESVNGIVVATRQSPAPTCQAIRERARATAKSYGFRFDFEEAPKRCETLEKYDLQSVPVLRDAAPKEFEALGEL